MKVSGAIKELEEILKDNGDIEVFFRNMDPKAEEGELFVPAVRLMTVVDIKDNRVALII